MKTNRKSKKKTASLKQYRSQTKTESQSNSFKKINTDIKNWSSTFSKRFLSNYAIPFAHLVEAKLISLQAKV